MKFCVKLWEKKLRRLLETLKTAVGDGFLNRARVFECAMIQGPNSVDDFQRSD